MFSSVYSFLQSLHLSPEDQDCISQAKLKFPFEKISSIDFLVSTTEILPRTEFTSLLRAETEIGIEDYNLFCRVWNILKAENLLQMFRVYLILDTAYLCDSLSYYFENIYQTTNLHPIYFRTISALALSSCLLHCVNPIKPHSMLRLPLLSKEIYEKFQVYHPIATITTRKCVCLFLIILFHSFSFFIT